MQLYIATLVILVLAWFYFWYQFRDPFHPAIILLPQFAFLYGYMPWELSSSDPFRFEVYGGGKEAIYRYQAITLGLIAALLAGVIFISRGLTRQSARWQMLQLKSPDTIRLVAMGMGLAGMAAWLTMVMNSGGFSSAYGSGYGGGWVKSGYIREMRYLGLVGALLLYVSRTGKGMRPSDWAIVILCITPTFVHAILGARRGPLFLSVIVLAGGYLYFMRKRVSIPMLIAAGAVLGGAMLFLVANRGAIHLGADLGGEFRDPTEHLLRWSSNEYLIGGTVIRYTDTYGAFYGAREFIWLVGRLLPKQIWPTVWTDLPELLGVQVNLLRNGGVSQEGLTTLANWTPSVGSAEGFTGSLYLEFGFLSPVAAFCIGLLYGKVWTAAKTSLAARVFYLLMVAMSVYLVMQALDPWAYRLLLFGIPAYITLRNIKATPLDAEIVEGGRVRALRPNKATKKRRKYARQYQQRKPSP